MNKYLAYYLRLSLDDGNINSESNSIASQRQLIKDYIYSSDEFIEMQLLEFVDDGCSGTNFNRPGIQKLLEAVKNGKIDCIIVKDFSRFGRQYLEVSKYIEHIFPYLGVRFIAINDNYDSNNHKGTTAEIDVPLRNMINAMYSLDISKKMKSAKQTKIKQGIFANSYPAYGYKKDNTDRTKLLIDEPAAAVVRQIFQLALEGNKVLQIATKLNNDGIPTPAIYKKQAGYKRKWSIINEDNSFWINSMIYIILHDERYTGTFVGGVWDHGELGSKTMKKKPKSEWVKKPNSHPAIITQEQFDTIAGMITRQRKNNISENSSRPLNKKVWCGNCNHMMRYKNQNCPPFYYCQTVDYSDKHGCTHDKIREKELSETVLNTLLMQIKLFIENEKLLRMIKKTIDKPNISTNNSISQLDNEIKILQSNKRKLYERYTNKEISKILYLQERDTLEKELKNKTAEREALVSQQNNHENVLDSTQKISQTFLKYQSETELTKEMVDEFIEAVNIYDSERIEIKFKFKDELETIMKIIHSNKLKNNII